MQAESGHHRPGLNRALILTCAVVWVWSAWRPHEYSTWALEQVATVLALITLAWLNRRVRFSATSRCCIAILFCIHTAGTHYTYSLTPYNELFTMVFGSSINEWFGWERNHYDRFVHLAYGLLLTLPVIEALQNSIKGGTGLICFFALQLILSSSALYELMEWSAAITFGGDAGTAYLGTQGDPWDAQADIALAGLGSAIAWLGISLRLFVLELRLRSRSQHKVLPGVRCSTDSR